MTGRVGSMLTSIAITVVACGGESDPRRDHAVSFGNELSSSVGRAASKGPSPPPLRPGPALRRGDWAVGLNDTCVSCHVAVAAQWRSSRHHHAERNHAYREAFDREPSAFCTSCHAPEARDPRRPTAAESALGVGCVSCHVVGDETDYTILSARRRETPELAPHPVTRSRDFALTGGCAGCHEFRFPGRIGSDASVFMQTTVGELESAVGEEASCLSCHMPERDHAFDQVRDSAWLAARLDVRVDHLGEVRSGSAKTAVAQPPSQDLAITLSLPRPSHAFPTGDLFRRLEVGVAWQDGEGGWLETQTLHLARHFEQRDDHRHGRALVADNRVHLGEVRLPFRRDEARPRASSVTWWVTLQRVAEIGLGHDESSVAIESEQRIHEGARDLTRSRP